MKLGPVTKQDKGNTLTSKTLTMTSGQKILTPWSFFQFMVNLQPSESQIPDTWSIKSIFSSIVTFYFTDPQNRTKTIALNIGTIFAKNVNFLPQKR